MLFHQNIIHFDYCDCDVGLKAGRSAVRILGAAQPQIELQRAEAVAAERLIPVDVEHGMNYGFLRENREARAEGGCGGGEAAQRW